MSGLIDSPAHIWIAVAPVDMRRGLDGLSAIVQQSLGIRLARARLLSSAIAPAIAYAYCCGMATACGCVSADCIKAVLFGPRPTMRCLRSVRRNGNGWSPVSIGSGYRLNPRRNGKYDTRV